MTTEQMFDKMHKWEKREHAAMFKEVAHPVSDYTPERVERLQAQMEQANRFTWPSDMRVNV